MEKNFKNILILFFIATLVYGCRQKSFEVEFESPYETVDQLENLNSLSNKEDQAAPSESSPPIYSTQIHPKQNQVLESPSNIKFSAKDVQRALTNAGFYKGNIDGKIGPQTKLAIKNFQQKNNLKADGTVGKLTWQSLGKYLQNSVDTNQKN